VADLIQLRDQISSCNSNPSIDWLAVQLVSHQLSISVPQLLGPELLQFSISCAMPSDVYNPSDSVVYLSSG